MTNDPDADPIVDKNLAAYIGPLFLLMAIGFFHPSFAGDQAIGSTTISHNTMLYMVLLVVQVAAVMGLLFYSRKIYFQQFPWRISWWGFATGIVGVVLWIGLCQLDAEDQILQAIGGGKQTPSRPAFNPFTHLPNTVWQSAFLFPRFLILAAVVPIAEEFFVRGWLVRYANNADMWELTPLNGVSWPALIAPTVYGLLTHPLTEAFAALVWFSLITLLMVKTKNLWDCVIAHAVTNFLLGVYVIAWGRWELW